MAERAPDARRAARRRLVAIVAHSYFDEDPRVRRQAEALLSAGHAVDVFALRRPGDAAEETVGGVRVRRIDVERHQGAGVITYVLEYAAFLVRACLALVRAHPRRRYALVQVATLPDPLVLAALPLRLVGVPVLLDLHEAMPAFFASRFPALGRGAAMAALRLAERVSVAAASHCLTVNDALRDRLVDLGLPADRIDVVANAPSLARFDPSAHPDRAFMSDGVLRLAYAGALTPTYEVAVALDALIALGRLRPGLAVHLDVYGRGDTEPALRAEAARPELAGHVTFHGRIPLDDVPAAIAAADVGLAPTRRDGFTELSLSTKILEYGAMGRPVVASRLPLVERAFAGGGPWTYEPGDAEGLARAVLEIVDDADERARRAAAMRSAVVSRSWEVESARYLAIVGRMTGASAEGRAGRA